MAKSARFAPYFRAAPDTDESDPISGWTEETEETEETDQADEAVISSALETQDGEPRGTVIPETPTSRLKDPDRQKTPDAPTKHVRFFDVTETELYLHNRELRAENYALRVKLSKLEAYEKLLTQPQDPE